jgi:predicted NBD/HSP70 family sugar kinase
LYGLNPDSGYFMGVELCATEVNIGVINFKGDMVHVKRHIPFVSSNTLQSLDEFCGIIKEFMDEVTLDKEKLLNINVNLIGRVNSDLGYSYSVFNLSERPLTEILSEKLGGFRVSIDNDTRAMAYGEFMQGIVRNEKNVLFINVSWGLAAGIIIDGKMYKGRSGFSGEFGHNYGYDNEILCHCGKKGCIETEASGLALHRILLEQLAKGKSSIIQQMKEDVSQITLDDIIEAVEREDMLCIELVEELGMKLGTHIAGLVNIFNPEMVVIGGLLSQTGDYLIQPIASTLRKYTLNLMIYDSFIVQSKLKDKAGIVGACMVARSRLFE